MLTQEGIIKKYHINELETCIDLIEDEIANKINDGNYSAGATYFDIVINCTGKCLLTLREIILLCKNGMPDGALGLARNLFEQFVIISRFELETDTAKQQEMVEKYCDDYDVQRYKNLRTMYEYAGDTDEAQKCIDELKALKNKYSINKFTVYWWCEENNFFAMFDFIIKNTPNNFKPMIQNLHISYKRACMELHANNLGNSNRISGPFMGVDLSPKDEGQEYALDLAIKSFIMVAMVAYKVLELDSKNANTKLNELAIYYQDMIQAKNVELQHINN